MAAHPLQLNEADLKMMVAAGVHIGAKNVTPDMSRYVWRRKRDGVNIINLGKTWEKLILAARIIVAVENPEDTIAVASSKFGQRAVFKFAQHTGTTILEDDTLQEHFPTKSKSDLLSLVFFLSLIHPSIISLSKNQLT